MNYSIGSTEQFRGIHGARKKTWYITKVYPAHHSHLGGIAPQGVDVPDTTYYFTRQGELVTKLTEHCVFPTKGLADDFLAFVKRAEF
jgi:hypothetical protein